MVQASWRRVLVGMLGSVLLVAGGCSSGQSSTRVDEKWLARVPNAQLEGVRQAEITQRKSEDEVTRAKVELQDAKHAEEIASRNQDAEKSKRKAAEVALQAATDQGQGAEIARAQEAKRQADLDLSTAQAEVGFRERAVKTLDSLQQMRERELAVADAELELARYQALLRSGDVRAQELSGPDFDKAVTEARSKASKTQQEVDANLQQQRQARAQWEQLRSQSQAYGGSGREGTPPAPPSQPRPVK